MGEPASGKSRSLKYLNQAETVYFNCDLKEIPFAANFLEDIWVKDPEDILSYMNDVNETGDEVRNVIVDTLSLLMSEYETQHVLTSANTQAAWQRYALFYKNLIHSVKTSSKNFAILAHAASFFNEEEGFIEKTVPIKGSVGKLGCEADFTTILSCKRMKIKDLKPYEEDNELLTITEDEVEDGYKYVFQTRTTSKTLGEKCRSAEGLFSRKELYIDNNIDAVFKRLNKYYSK